MLTPAMNEDLSQLVRLQADDKQDGSRVPLDVRRLFGLDAEALAACMVAVGEPAWRGRQLAEALYRQRVTELDAITTLPKTLRQRLVAEGWQVGQPAIAKVFQSSDGTERYLVECRGQSGAETVETVWMPEGDDGESGDESDVDTADEAVKRHHHATICVSLSRHRLRLPRSEPAEQVQEIQILMRWFQ